MGGPNNWTRCSERGEPAGWARSPVMSGARGSRIYLAALQKNQIHIVAQLDAPERARVETGERFAVGFYEGVRAISFYSFPVGG